MPGNLNIIGPQVRRLRCERELTQEMLVGRLATVGWNISRGTLAKIEGRVRGVTDREVQYLAQALRVEIPILYPQNTAAQKHR